MKKYKLLSRIRKIKENPPPLRGIEGVFLLMLLCSCHTTRYVAMPEVHRDTIIQHRLQHDSVYIMREKTTQKGLTLMSSSTTDNAMLLRVDTVFLKHTEYRYRNLIDTVRLTQRDSIPYPVEVIREVPSPIPRFYRTCTLGFFLIILCIILYVFLRIYLRR